MRQLFIILIILIATVTFVRTLGPLTSEEQDRAMLEKQGSALPQSAGTPELQSKAEISLP
ncbi:MAG: hypothetical protein LBV68_04510 [Spirochaetaceae bacterium]|jgi:hypothetical protein|nr:hypothetical protein [Spirochaetaceae bacterium]